MGNPADRDLRDTPFSVERLFVWAVGFVLVIGAGSMAWMAMQNRPIAPQVQSFTMIALGAFIARIERRKR